ncbi:aminotransferase class III-fold pyridoxal phosphate-dependent enzyme [Pseudomonas sp. CCI3.2]|uniref:aminotransferase class III-fold pyridoxal phosphate-dependent enzyme n=1 Tax=unclassified Pseudomonas TaxID=196821 RepID=UPI002AC8AF4C|nr:MULTISPECIES: aminotransferase class III-fold pyridoxal phosphate-dependent enzyme [unclassified Pseudomonas]MEB0079372.1 aminotransferase class III-fold pyridoxal phosphate-dependent enzyme [Pseudomonas sp. MH10out]MEB0092027.1 aminotransferase class III-fold pyridoxal phosphate-dependent enzyme [Pseudomonas sp. CCI4.2]MEB0104275.1 aminotransferase class III-fold pyridoxal phosphate-dependent enzyme [Pseudomonas sp. CCI3.2]MEB0123265.1 aminotransferase class III-fold pyridoxal phosphate-dep
MSLFQLLFNRRGVVAPAPSAGSERDISDDDAGPSLTELLRRSTSNDQVHLVDTGAQAREVAIGLTRKWGQQHRHGAVGIVSTCDDSVSASLNDLAALHAAVDSRTVAIVLEPRLSRDADMAATFTYFQGVAQLCRELKILLILDETRTGLGRYETLLCEDRYAIRADIVVLSSVSEGGRKGAAVLSRGTRVADKHSPASVPQHWGAVAA